MVGPGAVRPALFYRAADPRRGAPASPSPAAHARKSFTRRGPDRTPFIRRTFQAAFILLNLWIGARFYFFVRYYETGGQTVWVGRPPGVEGWLPIAGLMNLKYALQTGSVPEVHPAAMFLLVAFVAISFVLRKAFCSWLCPIGTLSEWLWEGGREMFGRNAQAPRWLDIPLRSLKYLLLGFFGYAVATMTVPDLHGFITSPYGLVADVKMLNFFRRIGTTGALVIAVLLIGSVFVKNLWCRYLCPYGALVGLVSLFSPARIRREAGTCIDCAKCAKACPSLLPVDQLSTVKSAECTGCLECVAVCPAAGALRLSVGRSRAIPTWAVAAAIAAIFLGIVGYAQVTGRWHSRIPDAVYRELIPAADSFAHPQ
ncbi:MAG TPA: 4Fe-4S binding protein [Vicinamibacterales bacterium]|nr:4Fe-4S binding protein [Vicinamibacterales bacterium]